MVARDSWTVRTLRSFPFLNAGLVLFVAIGCGGVEQEKGLTPVSGRVTLNGGPWPHPGQIIFTPTAAGKDAKASTVSYVADFGTDGNFTVITPTANGMKPGRYWVSVDCTDGPPKMPVSGEKIEDKNVAPEKYRNPNTSGLNLDVPADKATTATFDVKSK